VRVFGESPLVSNVISSSSSCRRLSAAVRDNKGNECTSSLPPVAAGSVFDIISMTSRGSVVSSGCSGVVWLNCPSQCVSLLLPQLLFIRSTLGSTMVQ